MSLLPSDPYVKSLRQTFIRNYLNMWGWLLVISKQHSIEPYLCEEIREFLEVVTRLRKEGDPLNIALAFKNSQLLLEQPLIQVESFQIKDHSKFSNLKDSINGRPLCYVLDGEGIVNIEQIPKELLCATSCLTLRNVSMVFKTITFCLENSILEANDLGKLIRVNRGGFWMVPCNMSFDLLNKDGFPVGFLNVILELCLNLSINSKGGIIVISKKDFPEFRSDLVKKEKFEKKRIADISSDQLMNFSMMDGAIVLNTKGELLDIAQKLEAPYSSDFFVESGRGTKHNSASMYSGAVDCVVFVVSHEGPITVYYKGKMYARCFGEIFGY